MVDIQSYLSYKLATKYVVVNKDYIQIYEKVKEYSMNGKEIQEIIKKKRLYQWEVAKAVGINEFTISRWLRGTLSEEREEMILKAIETLSKKEQSQNE